MTDEQFALLTEILKDAESSTRLSQWEEEFCDDLRSRVLIYKQETRLSDRQWEIVHRIEARLYA